MSPGNLIVITELMLIAVAVAVAVKYIRLPYTVALVLVGLAVGFSDLFESVHLSKEVILFVFLPPLLFEGTINMDLKTLKDRGPIVGVLALAGTLATTLLLGGLFFWLLDLPPAIALLLGAILSPTDPVSVLAIFKENGVVKGLSTIVEGESVFNDGIGVVLYLLLLQFIGGHELTVAGAFKVFVWEVAAGAAIGLLLGYFTHLVLGNIDDHLIEVLLSLILAYGSYLLAERFHCSGVVAVVCAGLIIGNYGKILSMSPKTRISLSHFWEVISFAVNSLLFLLIGIDLDSVALFKSIGPVALVFLFMILSRSLTVYLFSAVVALFSKKHWTPWNWRHVINWGGLRGSIPIALALGLPVAIAQRSDLINTVFGVVLLSLVIQGLTIKPLLKRLKIIGAEGSQANYENALAGRIAAKAAIRELTAMHQSGEISDPLFRKMMEKLETEDQEFSHHLALLKQEHEPIRHDMVRRVARRLGYAKHAALQQAFVQGVIGEEALEKLIRTVDGEMENAVAGAATLNLFPDQAEKKDHHEKNKDQTET